MKLEKLLNSNTFCVEKNRRYFLLYKKTNPEGLRNFLLNLGQELQHPKNIFFKNIPRDTTTVALVNFNNKKYVIKRYNFRNVWHALKLQFRGSRALRSLFFAEELSALGIKTIKGVGVLQQKWGFLRGVSYFVSEYADGIKGCEYFKNGSVYKNLWPKTISNILQLTNTLKTNWIYHGDYHFGNLVIVDEEAILLDLDRVQRFSKLNKKFQKLHEKDLQNFQRYLIRNLEANNYFSELDNTLFCSFNKSNLT